MDPIFRVERNARSSASYRDSQASQQREGDVLSNDERVIHAGNRSNQMSAYQAAHSITTRGRSIQTSSPIVEFDDLFIPYDFLVESQQKGDLKTLFDYPLLLKVSFDVALPQPALIKDYTTDIFTDQICQLIGEHLDKVATFCIVRPNFQQRLLTAQTWVVLVVSTTRFRLVRSKWPLYLKTFIASALKRVSTVFGVSLAGPVQVMKPTTFPKLYVDRLTYACSADVDPKVVDYATMYLLSHLQKIRPLARIGSPVDHTFQLIRCLEDYFMTPDVLFRSLKGSGMKPKPHTRDGKFDCHYDFDFVVRGHTVDTTKLSDPKTYRPAIDVLAQMRPLLLSGVVAHPLRAYAGHAVDHNERLIYVNGRSINDFSPNTSASLKKVYRALLHELIPIIVDGYRKTKRSQFVDFVKTTFFEPGGRNLISCALVSKELGLNIQADHQLSFDYLHVETIDTIHNVGIQNLMMPLFAQLYMSVRDNQTSRFVVYSSGYCNVDYTLWGADICSAPLYMTPLEDGRFYKRLVSSLSPEYALGYFQESLTKQVNFSPYRLTRKLINRLIEQYTTVLDVPSIPLHSLDEQTQMVLVALALVLSDFVWHATPSGNHTAFMLFGESSTGKSTLCRFLQGLLSLRTMTQDFVTAKFQGPPLIIGEYGLLADEQSLEAYMPTRRSVSGLHPFEQLKSVLSIPSEGLTIQTKNKNNQQSGFPRGSFIAFAGNLPLESYYMTLYNSYGHRGLGMYMPPIVPMLRKSTIVHTCWRISEGNSLAYRVIPSQDDYERADLSNTLSVDKFFQSNPEERHFYMLTKQLIELTFLYAHVRYAGRATPPDHERAIHVRRDVGNTLTQIATNVERGQCMYKKLLLQDQYTGVTDAVQQHVQSLYSVLRETHVEQFKRHQLFSGLLEENHAPWFETNKVSPYWSRYLVEFTHEMSRLVPFQPQVAGLDTQLYNSSPMKDFVSRGRIKTYTSNVMTLYSFVSSYVLGNCELHCLHKCFEPLLKELTANKGLVTPSYFLSRAYYNMRAILGLFSQMYNYCERRDSGASRLSPPQIQSFALADFFERFSLIRVNRNKFNLFSMRCAALLALKRLSKDHPATTRVSYFSVSDFVLLSSSLNDLFDCMEKLVVSSDGEVCMTAELTSVVDFCSAYICSPARLPDFLTVYSLFRGVNKKGMTTEMINKSASAYGTGSEASVPYSSSDLRRSVWNIGTYFACLLTAFFERKMILIDVLNGDCALYGEIVKAVVEDIDRQRLHPVETMSPLDVTLLYKKILSHQTQQSREWKDKDDSAQFVSVSYNDKEHVWWYDRAYITNDIANRHVYIYHTVVDNKYYGLLSSGSYDPYYQETEGLYAVNIQSLDMIRVPPFRADDQEESKVGFKRTFSYMSAFYNYNEERFLLSYDREDDDDREPSYGMEQLSDNSIMRR